MQTCEEKSQQLHGKLKEGLNCICWECAEEKGFHYTIVESLKCKVVSECVLCTSKIENT